MGYLRDARHTIANTVEGARTATGRRAQFLLREAEAGRPAPFGDANVVYMKARRLARRSSGPKSLAYDAIACAVASAMALTPEDAEGHARNAITYANLSRSG